jgi:hypothetical protein
MWEAIGRKISLKADPGKNLRPYLTNNQSKKGLRVWLKW